MSTSSTAAGVDPFFEKIYDGQWNACVGIQGDEQNYIDGYIEAALELVKAVLDQKLVMSRDTLAMPILYNARHALELSLKFTINRLHKMDAIAHPHVPNHDIHSHWTHLREAQVGDEKIRLLVLDLEPYVVSLANIDDDGQELRYATNREGKKSLDHIAIVNLPHIRKSLEVMSRLLEQLKFRIIDLGYERASGTHTKECSRTDLQVIATMLGDHTTWVHESFNDKKAAVQTRFQLSNNKFSDAINKIRQSRPLAAVVGIETALTHLSSDKAVFALERWAKANPERFYDPDDLGFDYFDRNWEKFHEFGRIRGDLIDVIAATMTNEEVSDLEVLFYIGRDGEFGEHYDAMLAQTVREHQTAESRLVGINHFMGKTNLLDGVIVGASAVGQPSLAARLQKIRRGPAEDAASEPAASP